MRQACRLRGGGGGGGGMGRRVGEGGRKGPCVVGPQPSIILGGGGRWGQDLYTVTTLRGGGGEGGGAVLFQKQRMVVGNVGERI